MSPTFDIGLVMAGAVSAGAYTGGTLDFLLQALDAWYDAKSIPGNDVPPHDARIKVVTGASAGGMSAAMLTTVLREVVPPIDHTANSTTKQQNKFYDAWVNRISIEHLLADHDLAGNHDEVQSVLDSTVLQSIADRMFSPGTARPVRPYVADPLVVALTLTNLRGVPYRVDFQGLSGTQIPYIMNLHADQITFAVGTPTLPSSGLETITLPDRAIALDPTDIGSKAWPTLQTAALATGAFPFGLAPRNLSQQAIRYNERQWFHPYSRTENGQTVFGFYAPLKSAMNVADDYNYHFTSVDGGVIDNEPIGLAREHLNWDRTASVPGSAVQAGLVLIDPFPNAEPFDEKYEIPKALSLLKLAPSLLSSLINQARFKPEELTRAIDPSVFNQFMLAPVRRSPSGAVQPNAIACGGLGGFAGFLSEAFRGHDFQLGRLNTQSFLRRHFVLPEDNPLFAGWSVTAKDRYRVHRDALNRIIYTENGNDVVYDTNGNRGVPVEPVQSFLPIVPLVGAVADQNEPSPTWPSYTAAQLDALQSQVETRSKLVVERMIQKVEGATSRFLLRRLWWFKRDQLLEWINKKVKSDLMIRGLWR